MKTLIFVTITLLAAAPLQAQTQEGPVLGSPIAMGIGEGTFVASGATPGVTDYGRIHRKTGGFVETALALTPPGIDDKPRWGVIPFRFVPVRVNALSIGEDVINASVVSEDESFPSVGEGWATLMISVKPGTLGTAGSHIEQQRLSLDGNGADIFSYVVPGSQFAPAIAACYGGSAQLAQDSSLIGLTDGSTPGDLTYLDAQIPLYSIGAPLDATVAPSPTVYFSVKSGDETLVPPPWYDDGSLPSAATIFFTRWIPTSPTGGFWTLPRVHLNFAELGLPLNSDLDALAIDREGQRGFYSLDNPSNVAQELQVFSWNFPGSDSPERGAAGEPGAEVSTGDFVDSPSGDSIAIDIGLVATDDDGGIDGLCTRDPSGQAVDCSAILGYPFGALPSKSLSFQMYRDDPIMVGSPPSAVPSLTFAVDGITPDHAGKDLEIYAWVGQAPTNLFKIHEEPVGAGAIGHRTIQLPAPGADSTSGTSVCVSFTVVLVGGKKVTAPFVGMTFNL